MRFLEQVQRLQGDLEVHAEVEVRRGLKPEVRRFSVDDEYVEDDEYAPGGKIIVLTEERKD
jgi:hypothetical protein